MVIGAYISVMKTDWSAPWSNDSWTLVTSVDAKYEAECQSDIANGMESKSVACVVAEIMRKKSLQIGELGTVPMPDGFDKLPHDQQKEAVDQMVETNWRNKFFDPLFNGLGVTLAISLAVYGIVRAIGWVIGGFAAS